jgi:outer membrane receptor protein involved in Fe transport
VSKGPRHRNCSIRKDATSGRVFPFVIRGRSAIAIPLAAIAAATIAHVSFAEPSALPVPAPQSLHDVVVTASRTPQPIDHVSASATVFESDVITGTPAVTLDGVLRSDPEFSLFRRTDSLIANPTAQGVSLRGLGPSGASRSLVLLDGIPLNDPFGGWVAWTKLPREAIGRIEVIPGGGATAWGNAALGGVVQILSAPLRSDWRPAHPGDSPGNWVERGNRALEISAGDFDTRSAELTINQPARYGIAQIVASDFSTDGFALVAPERRGAIDVPAWSRHRMLTAKWQQSVTATSELTATARTYEEFRGNGTPYQRNGSREKFAAVEFNAQPANQFALNAVAYAQDQSFASTFSSVNAARTAETPASDQFAVPAVALGAAVTGVWKQADSARTSGGIDFRAVHGETRENFTFVSNAFTRLRVAGGSQAFAGVFALHERPLGMGWHITAGARLDHWIDDNGHRRESDRTTGTLLRDDHYSSETGNEFSPTLGTVWTSAQRTWRLRANAQQAFRRPTLNELYRPFRQGANVTEANPALRTERATSGEMGIERTVFGSSGDLHGLGVEPTIILGATAFWNDLRDAVGNVTLARGPGTFPIVGTLGAGGIGRQRLNLDAIRVQGLELSATWRTSYRVHWNASILYDDATVRRATIAPALVGKRLAEVPQHAATFGATVKLPWHLEIAPRVRWIGRQWDDDENTLRLGEVVVADIGVTRPMTKNVEVFLNVENIGNARVETSRSADGVVNIGTPRFAFGGIRGKW